MAAKTKSELLAITRKEFEKLESLLDRFESDAAMLKREDDTSVKDIVAHRAHWIELFLGWHEDGLAGKEVHFPAKGYKWNELKRYNSELRKQQSDLDWPAAVAMLRRNCDRLVAFMESRTDSELYSGPMKGAKNDWTPGRWAEAAGASHFRSASKFLRSVLKRESENQD